MHDIIRVQVQLECEASQILMNSVSFEIRLY